MNENLPTLGKSHSYYSFLMYLMDTDEVSEEIWRAMLKIIMFLPRNWDHKSTGGVFIPVTH